MKEFIEKLKIVLTEMEKDHGELTLFSLFFRENSLYNRWDLVVSSPIFRNDIDSLKTVSSYLQAILKGSPILFSRIVILNHDDPALLYLRENFDVPSGNEVMRIHTEEFSDILGFTIERGYLLRCLGIENSEKAGNFS